MDTSRLLVSTVERDRAVDLLKQLYTAGNLDHFDFDQRVEAALRSRTRAELNAVFDGLPLPPASPAAATSNGPGKEVVLADDRVRSGLTQWLGYPTFFVGPLIVAYTAGQRSPALKAKALEAANFQLTTVGVLELLSLAGAHMGMSMVLLQALVGVVWMALTGLAGLITMLGGNFRYPFTVRLFGSRKNSPALASRVP